MIFFEQKVRMCLLSQKLLPTKHNDFKEVSDVIDIDWEMWQYWQYLLIALQCLLSTQCRALVSPATGWQQKPLPCPHTCPRQLESPFECARSSRQSSAYFPRSLIVLMIKWAFLLRRLGAPWQYLLHNVILVIVSGNSAPARN